MTDKEKLAVIKDFYREVCDLAESKMLKTGKLEGAHFASMKEIIKKFEKLEALTKGD